MNVTIKELIWEDKIVKRNKLGFRILTLLLCTIFLAACGTNSAGQAGTEPQVAVTEAVAQGNVSAEDITAAINALVVYDEDDYYSDWKDEDPNYIELSGTSAGIKGTGVQAKDGKIAITAAGVYVLSGKLDNGQVIVDVQDKGTVRLILNGADITSADSAPIYVKNAGKTIITLQDGTENSISDGASYVYDTASSEELNSAIFSKDNLTINGNGTLTVNGNYNNGITSRDDLKITGGNIKIFSTDDALLGRDMVAINAGSITVEAGGDGIRSSNDTDASKGLIAILDGSFSIKAGKDGIQAATSLLINGGSFDISAGGGSANAKARAVDKGFGQRDTAGETASAASEEESMKAIKASKDIAINGGSISIDSADDAIHGNGNVAVAGGVIKITSGDDGIHADLTTLIKGGEINIVKSYEGVEGAEIAIAGGQVHITSDDDGINVSGGNDGSSVNGRAGQNSFSTNGSGNLNISGGYVVLDSEGDGLDSNGSIYMSGGTVLANGPVASMNGALDYNGAFEISGGLLIAAGSAAMAQAPSEQSMQNSVLMYYPQVQQAGTVLHLKDGIGNTIVTFAPAKDYQTIVISSPELKKDTEYALYTGGTSTGNNSDGLYTDGEYKEGTKIIDFGISKSVMWMSETGETTQRSMGPGMGGRPIRPEPEALPPADQ